MRIKLNKVNAGIPMVTRHSFAFSTRSFGFHNAEVILTKDGEYSLTVDGYAYSPYEASAKRSVQYKNAISAVTNEMQNAIESYNDLFVNLAKKTVRPQHRSDVEGQLGKLVLKHYERSKYNLPQPSKSEVKADLQEEADSKFFSIWSGNSAQKFQFVADNVEDQYNQRMQNWEELKRYHESIQDYFETQANKQYQQEFDTSKKVIEDELYGDEKHVKNKLLEIASKYDFKLPFDVTLEVDYNKKDGLIDATASIPSLLYIPDKKAVPLASGKISVKEKLKRELDTDTANTLLGLSYYLTGHLFSLSININMVRLSVVTGYSAYYWVQFERSSFATIPFSALCPLQDFFKHPNVIDYRKTSVELIPEADFQNRISDAIKVADALAGNCNLVALSLKEAEAICKAVIGTDDLKQATKEAKANKSTVVIADKRYQNILNELEEE